jgi:hypothetical protein
VPTGNRNSLYLTCALKSDRSGFAIAEVQKVLALLGTVRRLTDRVAVRVPLRRGHRQAGVLVMHE